MNYYLRRIIEQIGGYYQPFVILLMSGLVFLLISSNLQAEDYNIQLNQVADETIRAPYTEVDTVQTEIQKERVSEAVPDVYLFHPDIRENQLNIIEQFFSELRRIRSGEYSSEQLAQAIEENPLALQYEEFIDTESRTAEQEVPFGQLNDEERLIVYLSFRDDFSEETEELASNLNQNAILHLLTINDANLTEFQTNLTQIISDVLENEIFANEVSRFIQELNSAVVSAYQMTANQQTMQSFLQQLVVPTMVFNEEETMANREAAVAQVPPTYVLQGQVIIQEGHIVDAQAIQQLELFNFFDADSPPYLMIVFIITLITHAVVLFLIYRKQEKMSAGIQLTAYSTILVGSIAVLKAMHIIQENGTDYFSLIFPALIIPLMLIDKIGWKMSLLNLISFTIFSMFIFNNPVNILSLVLPVLYFFMSGIFAFVGHKSLKTNQIHHEYLFNMAIHTLFALILLVVFSFDIFSNVSYTLIVYMLLNVTIAYGVYLLVSPYWDQLLSDRAPLTLNQLGNLNHPLLKKLIEVAPGTYHHSILVANLSANAVETIGGNSLLTRVASYYHDVGKTLHPLFFVENLPSSMESPHQMVSAKESADIIIGHVTEGIKLLEDHGMPKSVIDICSQHHGTTSVKYFYFKAKEVDESVKLEDFCYPGPIPQSKEAAIIMIADSIEAASRTMKDHSQPAIEQLVTKIIDDKMAANQFVDCQLTVHELKLVKASFISGVGSMYHTRIEYPD